MPKNASGFGNVIDAAIMIFELEIVPIQQRLREVNDWLGLDVVWFEECAEPDLLWRALGAAYETAAA